MNNYDIAYQNHLLDAAKGRIMEVIREFHAEHLHNRGCNIEEITDIIHGLNYAKDIIKELRRSNEWSLNVENAN